MRTTLTIDDDVLRAAKAIAERDRRSLGEIVSDLARRSLAREMPAAVRNGVPLLPLRQPGTVVTSDQVNALRDEAAVTFLLDVNVLIALIDPAHVAHDAAHSWFDREGRHDWATCPLTENGVLRIVSHPRYPNAPATTALVAKVLKGLLALPNHRFWSDDLSLLDESRFEHSRLLSTGQVTDSYLLALALAHGGRLATFDRKLTPDAVRGGRGALHLI